jgi:hypothetical protein
MMNVYSYIANIRRQRQNDVTNAAGSQQLNATADDDLVMIRKSFFLF